MGASPPLPPKRFTPPLPARIIMPMKNLSTFIVSAITALMITATQAWAALPAKPADDNPDKPYMAYGVAILLVACVSVVTFKSAKRSHLD